MKNNAFDIVVAITPDGVSRLDLPDGKLLSSSQRDGSPSEALAIAFGLGRVKRNARVLVLSTDFFSQTVRLPRRQIAGLSAAEIETALAYEIEPFSNIPRDQGVAAFQALTDEGADTSSWRTVQIARADWDSLDAAAIAADARLAGCAPLASLPASDEAIAGALLQYASDALSSPPRIPVAAVASTTAKSQVMPKVAATLYLLVAIACLLHYVFVPRMRDNLRTDVEEREALAAANATIANEIRAIEARSEQLKKNLAARNDAALSLSAYRKAWSSLLHDLVTACGDDVMVRSISGDVLSGGVMVEAIATDVDAPASFMVRLADLTAKNGWMLTPRDVRNETKGPSSFRFSLEFSGKPDNGGAK